MPQIAVHDLAQARAALAAATRLGVAVRLRSAPDAAGYAGVGYLKALGDGLGHELLIDCGDDAGLVMAALRTGCRRLAFSGPDEIAAKLGDMAEQLGAEFHHERAIPTDLLVLAPESDASSVVAAWLEARRAQPSV